MPRANKAGIGLSNTTKETRVLRSEYSRVRGNAWKRAQREGITRTEFRADFPTLKDLDKTGRASPAILRARVRQEQAGAAERRAVSTANLLNQGTERRSVLSWEPGAYTVAALRKAGLSQEKEMRAEYGRLRSILERRYGRIQASEEFQETSMPSSRRPSHFPKLSEIPRGEEGQRRLIYGLYELSRAVESPLSQITGLRGVRERSLETLHEHGYSFVNKENFEQFGRFMELARIMGMNRLYDSKRVANQYRSYLEERLTETEMLDRFQEWVDQQPAAKQVSKIPVSSQRARRSLV